MGDCKPFYKVFFKFYNAYIYTHTCLMCYFKNDSKF